MRTNSAVFLNIVQKAVDSPTPLVLNIMLQNFSTDLLKSKMCCQKVLKFAKRLAKNNYDLQIEQLILTNWLTLDYCSLSVAHLKSEMHQVSYSTYFFAAPRIRFVHSSSEAHIFRPLLPTLGRSITFPSGVCISLNSILSPCALHCIIWDHSHLFIHLVPLWFRGLLTPFRLSWPASTCQTRFTKVPLYLQNVIVKITKLICPNRRRRKL